MPHDHKFAGLGVHSRNAFDRSDDIFVVNDALGGAGSVCCGWPFDAYQLSDRQIVQNGLVAGALLNPIHHHHGVCRTVFDIVHKNASELGNGADRNPGASDPTAGRQTPSPPAPPEQPQKIKSANATGMTSNDFFYET